MATGSFIALAETLQNGMSKFDSKRKVTSIYCHNDGYLEHNGVILHLFYNNVNSIQQLLNLGSIASLGYIIGKKHDWKRRMVDVDYYAKVKFMTCSYKRDRGEPDDMSEDTYKGILGEMPLEEWNYLFIPEDKKWYVMKNKKWVNIEDVILKDLVNITLMKQRVSADIDPNDKQALAVVETFAKKIERERKKHPVLPSYTIIYDKNEWRKDTVDCVYQGRFFGDIADMKIVHIESIEKTEGVAPNNRIVRFTYKTLITKKTGKGAGLICEFCRQFMLNELIVLKNPSKLMPFCK